jgi:membrane-associated phospholipid phosphatase
VKSSTWLHILGVVGTFICLGLFITQPSFPTPDKLLIVLVFVFLIFGQAKDMLLRLGPFVALLLLYESFRGLADHLNSKVEYVWMIKADEFLFKTLPTRVLQGWFWHGTTQWYDFVFYLSYMLHFVLPIGLAIIIWKLRDKSYWQYVWTFVAVSFMGFFTFLLFPAAPPWMAAEKGYIQPITRISSEVWKALGVKDFPSVYNKISPNPVAAVPSLHAAYATLLVIFVWKLFGKKWGLLALIYPVIIFVGTVYSGEHYAIDEILGILYAIIAYLLVRWLYNNETVKSKLTHLYVYISAKISKLLPANK